ncbi:hypothetical protein [Gimesia chilikensis]|jgi:predicted small lipoprotein YifL|uniref:Carboxypeptidase regulatory-like domain-containing protein n=1 Tax=Gimesia chilikensis TaxID=2605989 RepID=A0A517PJ34_9PLAN|nr:hypothetical protein [Gimesia chilikensis]QDT19397.1 hypothetical protein HG66A1_11620 [Gimesia chilikensis]QDT83485.1 hypothetical protein MalM14_11170 [Gimesia chilikensis]
MKTVAYYLMLACTAGVLAGCGGGESGPTNYPVSGKVTVDGEPLAEGDIIFRDAEGKATSGAGKIEEGTFSFETVAGKKAVVITATREIPGKTVAGGAPGEPAVPAVEQYLPAEYNEKTTLEAEVSESGPNEFTFELKTKGE